MYLDALNRCSVIYGVIINELQRFGVKGINFIMDNPWGYLNKLGFNLGSISIIFLSQTLLFSANCASAQITPDNTLPNNSRITTISNIQKIEGGTQAGSNLFHSFEQFSIPTGNTAYFNNALDIQNIISRVTGKSISNIDGIIHANGAANLFLINPNGIIFGNNASLNIGGSFIATTASSLNFADGTKYSATFPQNTPLLTISIPTGLQFGTTSASIRNQSQANPTSVLGEPGGLQVQPFQTLALVGGDITLEEGSLTAPGGRIELGSVGNGSLVSLNPVKQGWALRYENALSFQNILLTAPINGDVSSLVTTSSQDKTGSIQVRGNLVELVGSAYLVNANYGTKDAGDITVTANNLSVRDGAQITSTTLGSGQGGNITVNASESVDVASILTASTPVLSVIATTTASSGNAGNITINTGRLGIQNGGLVSVESSGQLVSSSSGLQLLPAKGRAGNLTINATKSVELIGKLTDDTASALSASTLGSGDAGKMTINTEELIIKDGAEIILSSVVENSYQYLGDRRNLGQAGDLDVNARSIVLDNQGRIVSESDLGKGGDITLQVQDFLLMRQNSQISTNAGTIEAIGDGGNIKINAPDGFIVADPNNNDITANAFDGTGGRVQINATGILGIEPRSRAYIAAQLGTNNPNQLDPSKLPTSDITAISQVNPNLNGVVIIKTLDIDTSHGLVEIQEKPQEPKLTQVCQQNVAAKQSRFIVTGRGGLPSNPKEMLQGSSIQADWISLGENVGTVRKVQVPQNVIGLRNFIPSASIIEAQGWVVDSHGDISLVDSSGEVTPHSSGFNFVTCQRDDAK